MKLRIRRLDHARDLPLPRYETAQAAGLDLVAAVAETVALAPGARAAIPCGIAIALPDGYEAQVRPRSGLAAKHGVPAKTEGPAANAEFATTGAKIAGETGYSCIACHDSGSRKALQVFEGQGPNLALAGERLRYDYFQRWMHWPQRIAPTTIMPRYTKDRDHAQLDAHFGGDASKQFEAVWQWAQTLKAAKPAP